MEREKGFCFACLKAGLINTTNVSQSDLDGIKYLDKLETLSVNMDVFSNYDLQMCNSCLEILNLCYKFRQKILESLEALENKEEKPCDISSDSFLNIESEEPIINDDPNKSEFDNLIEQMKHSKRLADLTCKKCTMMFKSKRNLRQHMTEVHKGELICRICGNSVETSDLLEEHLSNHNDSKNFICPHCEKGFSKFYSLKKHMRSHYEPPGQKSKKTPFLCNICGKSFPFSNGAARHMRIHLGVKGHECQICHRKFNQSTHLIVHMRTHSGEKPYICENCGKSFTLLAGLQKHLRSYHKISSIQSLDRPLFKEEEINEEIEVNEESLDYENKCSPTQ